MPGPALSAGPTNKPAGLETRARTGWTSRTRTSITQEFVKREFGGKSPVPRGVHWLWWVVALLVAAAFAFMLLR